FDLVIREIDRRDGDDLAGLDRLSVFLDRLLDFLFVDHTGIRYIKPIAAKRHCDARRGLFGDDGTENLEFRIFRSLSGHRSRCAKTKKGSEKESVAHDEILPQGR